MRKRGWRGDDWGTAVHGTYTEEAGYRPGSHAGAKGGDSRSLEARFRQGALRKAIGVAGFAYLKPAPPKPQPTAAPSKCLVQDTGDSTMNATPPADSAGSNSTPRSRSAIRVCYGVIRALATGRHMLVNSMFSGNTPPCLRNVSAMNISGNTYCTCESTNSNASTSAASAPHPIGDYWRDIGMTMTWQERQAAGEATWRAGQ